MVGTVIAHYEILEKVGEGGMGIVYRARDTRLDRFVAIKVLPEEKVTDAERKRRFVLEAKTASALNHPNIVTIHEIGEQDGGLFIVMEFVNGKPLTEAIPRKGMRITEALRVATQVADALTAAHGAGIVHRDLKPGNIMVDAHGRVKVLDFGLAKVVSSLGADESTRTVAVDPALTEEGAIVGSVPYMSPEQAEARPVDARSDIFSFGAVLYEMVTGQRAFQGGSRISTLAAIVEKEPQPPSDTGAAVPPELERLILRCLRKDVERRSQNMADVKLALEELRDESESGKLMSTVTGDGAHAFGRRWLWPALSCLIALAVVLFSWVYVRGAGSFHPSELVRVSPDDGHMDTEPAISRDGKFVAYVSDRGGTKELWLQQIRGRDPIQLTHGARLQEGGAAAAPQFFPDDTQILYVAGVGENPLGQHRIQTVPTLGGEPRVLVGGYIYTASLSPDGNQVAYFDVLHSQDSFERRLMIIPAGGGRPKPLPGWKSIARVHSEPRVWALTWTPGGRAILVVQPKRAGASLDEWDWFAVPLDGGEPVMTGAGDALRAAGFSVSSPLVVTGNRVVFSTEKSANLWDVAFSEKLHRVSGTPRQITFGTENASINSVSSTGTVALEIATASSDLYLLPLDSRTGRATGTPRRLTSDRRLKYVYPVAGGEPHTAYFAATASGRAPEVWAVDLVSAKQNMVAPPRPDERMMLAVSRDGRQAAYSVSDGGSYSIRVGEVGTSPKDARLLCEGCGLATSFSPDGRFVFYNPETKADGSVNNRKLTVWLLDLTSGNKRLWLEHPTESVDVDGWVGEDAAWIALRRYPPGAAAFQFKPFMVRWRDEAVPVSQWIETKLPFPVNQCPGPPPTDFGYCIDGGKLMAFHLDPKTGTPGAPFAVSLPPGSPTQMADLNWMVRAPGLVFTREEVRGSVWLMKLPE